MTSVFRTACASFVRRLDDSVRGMMTIYVVFMAGAMAGMFDALSFTMERTGAAVLLTCVTGMMCGAIAACILKLHEGIIATLAMAACAWPMAVIVCVIEGPFYAALGMAQVIIILYCCSAYIGSWIGEGVRIAFHRLGQYWDRYSSHSAL